MSFSGNITLKEMFEGGIFGENSLRKNIERMRNKKKYQGKGKVFKIRSE